MYAFTSPGELTKHFKWKHLAQIKKDKSRLNLYATVALINVEVKTVLLPSLYPDMRASSSLISDLPQITNEHYGGFYLAVHEYNSLIRSGATTRPARVWQGYSF